MSFIALNSIITSYWPQNFTCKYWFIAFKMHHLFRLRSSAFTSAVEIPDCVTSLRLNLEGHLGWCTKELNHTAKCNVEQSVNQLPPHRERTSSVHCQIVTFSKTWLSLQDHFGSSIVKRLSVLTEKLLTKIMFHPSKSVHGLKEISENYAIVKSYIRDTMRKVKTTIFSHLTLKKCDKLITILQHCFAFNKLHPRSAVFRQSVVIHGRFTAWLRWQMHDNYLQTFKRA